MLASLLTDLDSSSKTLLTLQSDLIILCDQIPRSFTWASLLAGFHGCCQISATFDLFIVTLTIWTARFLYSFPYTTELLSLNPGPWFPRLTAIFFTSSAVDCVKSSTNLFSAMSLHSFSSLVWSDPETLRCSVLTKSGPHLVLGPMYGLQYKMRTTFR